MKEKATAYEVIARKWRPKQFADVVGQEHVTRTLINAINTGRVAHAYLFVGPRGIGKTSIARILAKALNCHTGITSTPCDKCNSCVSIAAGNDMDVQEIDGASNRGIDEIRELRQNARYSPLGRHKIYIIDEVHMLTPEAFNALLKTLEEPPAHVKFFMATTEPQKIPATILSRCQRFDLRRIPLKLLVDRLKLISKEEDVNIEDEALLAVARASEGGLRDAESALDQLIAFQGKTIKEEHVLAVFGLASRRTLEELAYHILSGNISQIVSLINEFDINGIDMQRILIELLEHMRNLLIYIEAGNEIAKLDLLEGQMETLKQHAAATNSERVFAIIDILAETIDKIRFALSRKTLVETALIKAARLVKMVPLLDLIDELKKIKSEIGRGTVTAPPPKNLFGAGNDDTNSKAQEEKSAASTTSERDSSQQQPYNIKKLPQADIELLKNEWRSFVEKVGKLAKLAEAPLLNAMPVAMDEMSLTLRMDPEFASDMQRLQEPRNKNAIQAILFNMFKRRFILNFELKPLDDNNALDANKEGAERKTSAPEKAASKTANIKQKAALNKAVQQTLDAFNGTIQEVRSLEE
jgi:DNA polymerase-3 subunit gamma/tau